LDRHVAGRLGRLDNAHKLRLITDNDDRNVFSKEFAGRDHDPVKIRRGVDGHFD
jgi:hypothetical protein